MEVLLRESEYRLEHRLGPLFEKIKNFSRWKDFKKSALYRQYGGEIQRIARGSEWKNIYERKADSPTIRVVAWNVERGRNLEGVIRVFETHPVLCRADVILLTEADIGMGRSGNYNIPREIADALEMNYCYANSFIVLAKGDESEQAHDQENTLGLHGTAILSKHKIISYRSVTLPSMRDYFSTFEKRIGDRKGLICKIRIGPDEYAFAAVHLELKASPRQRAVQLDTVLRSMVQFDARAYLLGGDLNTHTYNLKNKLRLFQSFLYKVAFLGFREAINHYMMPEAYFEKPVFEVFQQYGFEVERYNDRTYGTFYYDVDEESLMIKAQKWAPLFLYRWLRKQLAPWNGLVPFRLDWLAGKEFRVIEQPDGVYGPPQVVEIPPENSWRISDHHPIVADIRLSY